MPLTTGAKMAGFDNPSNLRESPSVFPPSMRRSLQKIFDVALLAAKMEICTSG
jgi:hypothetical protein